MYRTLTGYAERGWKVFFVTGNRTQGTCDVLHENIQVIRFDAPWLKPLMQIQKIGFFTKILWWVYFQVKVFPIAHRLYPERRFNVVYGYEIYGVPVAKVLSKVWRIPIVGRFQGSSLGEGWMKSRFWRLRTWQHVVGYRIPVDLSIMTNDGTRGDRILETLGVDMEHVRFWMNGVDWDTFATMPTQTEARRQLGIGSRQVLLTVSRLVSWKCVDRAISALPGVLQAHPDSVLIVVGDGPDRERLEGLAETLGVRDHIRFAGAVPHREIPTYLVAADIFLSFYDLSNVGNPLLEAMMAGKCIVTLNNGDTGRLIKKGETGVLLEYEHLPKLPHVIKELLANNELRNRLGANARKFAEEHFWSWEERIEAEVAEVSRLIEQCEKRRYGDG